MERRMRGGRSGRFLTKYLRAPSPMCARLLAVMAIAFANILLGAGPVLALEPIVIGTDQEKIEISLQGEFYEGRGDQLQVETAEGEDGIAGRMAVRAATPGTNPNWMVFALNNRSDKRIERWLTADRYSIVGSGVFWPNLDSQHIVRVTPSLGFRPERIKNDNADIFRIELEAGATVTFIAELKSDRIPRLFLWQARAFEKRHRDLTLFNGILLGITGLLAVFLTAIFVANHKAIFPSMALIAWSVVAYLCVDFGFWHKIFQLNPEDNAVYRAGSEAMIAFSLVVFLFTFLRLSLWHGWIRALFGGWFLAQLALVGLALLDAKLASGLARGSFAVIGVIAGIVVTFMKYSRMGQAIRATAQDARAAKVMGIDTERVYAFTYALNAAICAAAGVLVSMIWVIQPFFGLAYSIRAFVVVTAAGLGNLPGVIAAALGLGFAEQFGGFILGAEFQQAIVVGALVLVLIVRQVQQGRQRQAVV